METNTAKHFALQLGSLASLYLSLAFFLVLVFALINLLFPDPLENYWRIDNNASMVRLGFAMTIVFFPAYLWLTRTVNHARRTSSDGAYLGLTKWLIYLSLLIGGAVLLGDLVAIIAAFLEGDLTTRFLLKALAVLIVAGAACFYYVKDAQGYWLERQWESILYGTVSTIIILGTLVFAVAYIETPAEVRERKTDQNQIQDLRDIQLTIEDYLQSNERLPEGIMAAYEGRSQKVPTAPIDRASYRYELTSAGFQLCAQFAHDAQEDSRYYPYYETGQTGPHMVNPDDWYYETGEWCFEREVRF